MERDGTQAFLTHGRACVETHTRGGTKVSVNPGCGPRTGLSPQESEVPHCAGLALPREMAARNESGDTEHRAPSLGWWLAGPRRRECSPSGLKTGF